jgi:hypothetical protein
VGGGLEIADVMLEVFTMFGVAGGSCKGVRCVWQVFKGVGQPTKLDCKCRWVWGWGRDVVCAVLGRLQVVCELCGSRLVG